MESNSDKEMRDKLRGVELPFDPKAWEQMEAMLEKERKPKAFIWWWTGGIAAALILATGILGYHQFYNHTADNNTLSLNTQKQNNNQVNTGAAQPVHNNVSNNANSAFNENTASNNQTNALNETGHATEKQPVSSNSFRSENKLVEKTTIPVKTGSAISAFVTKNVNASTQSKASAKHSNKTAHNLTTGSWQQAKAKDMAANKEAENQVLTGNPSEAINHETTSSSIAPSITAADAMLMMKPDALTTADKLLEEDITKKESEDVNLKKLKKKVAFIYSIGIAANVTGSTLGKQQGSNSIFDSKPSYMVGLTQDFMFIKRIAITTGFMFSQTSFTVPAFNYTCSITELNIPVGVKAYLVSKSKVRFYADAGIINHIKLKETFTSLNPVYANNLVGSFPATFSPSGGFANSFSGYDQSTTANYSINKGKRYYASFYAGAGAEFIVKAHLVFFAEPVFYMGLEKISAPDKYKYNVGLSGGFRYQF
jgi:Outer membrane protein beta-barrel domain